MMKQKNLAAFVEKLAAEKDFRGRFSNTHLEDFCLAVQSWKWC